MANLYLNLAEYFGPLWQAYLKWTATEGPLE
jgi:hypothetical protein